MLLRDLTIENYRSFDKYRLDNLARVNLLVGDNNCGKTSVLEAVRLFVTGGDISVILDCLELREDTAYELPPLGTAPDTTYNAISLFHTAELESDLSDLPVIRLSSIDHSGDRIEISAIEKFGSTSPQLNVDIGGKRSGKIEFNDSGRVSGPWTKPYREPSSFSQKIASHVYIPAQGLTTNQLSGLWSSVLRARREQFVEGALKIIHGKVGSIHVLPGARQRREILIDIESERSSLARLGGGSITMLGIGIAIARTKDGVLLIDEIDTGLHYSRLPDMWKMVIQSAKDLDVQVFATTHSLDCLRGLDAAIRKQPELAPEIAVHKIDRRTDHSAVYRADELHIAMQNEIEVR